jgi:hypothetical protein
MMISLQKGSKYACVQTIFQRLATCWLKRLRRVIDRCENTFYPFPQLYCHVSNSDMLILHYPFVSKFSLTFTAFPIFTLSRTDPKHTRLIRFNILDFRHIMWIFGPLNVFRTTVFIFHPYFPVSQV